MNLFITHTSEFTQALCAMLLNSLWQGMFLALFAGGVILFTRRSRPALRYNLLVAGLCLFSLSSGISLYKQLSWFNKTGYPVTVKPAELEHPVERIRAGSDLQWSSILTELFRSWSGVLVWAWFLIVLIKCIRMSIGLYEVNQLKTQYISPVSEDWEKRIRELAGHIGLSRPVRLLQSSLAKVPMVIGHLKPVILVPVGLATALSTAEVEAILLHELAHVRRRDYLVNVMQSVLEILFFFNPAVLWVSTLIKTERESCCDDISIRQTEQKAVYVRALLHCQEFGNIPGYALAMSGSEGALVKRVKRIVSSHNPSLRSPEKAILGLCMLFACIFTLAFSGEVPAPAQSASKIPVRVASAGSRPESRAPQRSTGTRVKVVHSNAKAMAATVSSGDTLPRKHEPLAPLDTLRAQPVIPVKPEAPSRPIRLEPMSPLPPLPPVLKDRAALSPTGPVGEAGPPATVPYTPYTETYYPMDADLPTMGQLVPFLSRRGSPVDINNAQIIFSRDKLVVNGKTQPEQLHKEMMLAFGMPEGTVTWTTLRQG